MGFKSSSRSNNLPTFVTRARRYIYVAPAHFFQQLCNIIDSVVITKEDPEMGLCKPHIQLFRMTFKVHVLVKFFRCLSIFLFIYLTVISNQKTSLHRFL